MCDFNSTNHLKIEQIRSQIKPNDAINRRYYLLLWHAAVTLPHAIWHTMLPACLQKTHWQDRWRSWKLSPLTLKTRVFH